MKTGFLVSNLFFSLALCSSLFSYDIPGDYTHINCVISRIDKKINHASHPRIPGSKLWGKRGQYFSTNWSGYAAATNLNNPATNSVSAVYGSWIVPKVGSNRNSYCAFWVGIDGFSNSTVEQIGTAHDFINGVAQHYAWFEMYPAASFIIGGFPLTSGDVISASVEYVGNGIFTLRLINNTKKVLTTIPSSYTTSLTAQRSSAEWIVEAPFLNGVLPLNNFGFAYLWGCIANINGVLAQFNNSSWQNGAVTMVTNNGTAKAIPSLPLQDNGSFFITWKHQ